MGEAPLATDGELWTLCVQIAAEPSGVAVARCSPSLCFGFLSGAGAWDG